MRLKRIHIALLAFLLAGVGFWLWSNRPLPLEAPARDRIPLFGGEFIVVARTSSWPSFIAMPGQSGDRSGVVSVYRKDGTLCGSVPVRLIGNYSIDYDETGTWISVERPAIAEWDLRQCGKTLPVISPYDGE